jgi:hypothetical protein
MPPKGGSKVAKKAAAAPVAAAGMPPAIPASDREREEDEDYAPPFIDWKAKLQRPSNAPPGVQPAADSVQLVGEEEEPQAGYPSDKEDDGPGSCLSVMSRIPKAGGGRWRALGYRWSVSTEARPTRSL